ncbi:uncharacterized protein LOC144344790 [Saccoglossus kowalevskii]
MKRLSIVCISFTLILLVIQELSCQKCQDVDPICGGFYNQTVFPNHFGHTSFKKARRAMSPVRHLISDCPAVTKLFLCSLYMPVCTILENYIPPCYETCQAAFAGCEELPVVQPDLKCDDFPPSSQLCIGLPTTPSHQNMKCFFIACVSFTLILLVIRELSCQNWDQKCKDVDPICGGFYNRTVFPNYFGHTSFNRAKRAMSRVRHLISDCPAVSRLFLCVLYMPVCTGYDKYLPPCYETCQAAFTGCEELSFRHSDLNCDDFPSSTSSSQLCIEPTVSTTPIPQNQITTVTPTTIPDDGMGDCQLKFKMKYFSTACMSFILILLVIRELSCQTQNSKCQDIDPICGGFYNQTVFPNHFGHTSFKRAKRAMSRVRHLISDCPAVTKLFLCSLYMPVCTVLDDYIPPCYETCQAAFAGCEELSVLQPDLNCDDFPPSSQNICIASAVSTTPAPQNQFTAVTPTTIPGDGIEDVSLDHCHCKIQCDCPGI